MIKAAKEMTIACIPRRTEDPLQFGSSEQNITFPPDCKKKHVQIQSFFKILDIYLKLWINKFDFSLKSKTILQRSTASENLLSFHSRRFISFLPSFRVIIR